jgi:peptide deformylase
MTPTENPRNAALAKMIQLPEQLRTFGDPVLREQCTPFTADDLQSGEYKRVTDELSRLLGEIRSTAGIGRGLAAPQIGIARRMFVVFDPQAGDFRVFGNPVITAFSDERGLYREMCLSGVPLSAEVIRPWEVQLEYLDADGTPRTVSADPMMSRIIQHETDHLDGVLFTDRADVRSIVFDYDWSIASSRPRSELRRVE